MLPTFVRKRKPNSMNTENYTMEEQVPLSKSPSRASALDIEVSDAKENLFTAYNDTYTPNDDTYAAQFLPKHIVDKLYPTNVPRAVQLLRKENIAVPACYLCVGLLQGLSGPFINVYPRFLEATEAQQATISSIRSLPASFKLIFGFFSDNVPFLGYRRKAYMFIGWAMSSAAMFVLLFMSNLERVEQQDNDGNTSFVPPEDAPSIGLLSLSLLVFGIGFWFADVMGDSIVAEKAKLEPEHTRGHLQSTCYACRFFGLMIAAPVSTYLYSTFGPKLIVTLMCITPCAMLIPIFNLYEIRYAEIKSTRDQCNEIWNTVCSRAVWQPMGFVYIYNCLQVGNQAWREFLMSVLLFTEFQMNTLLIVAYVLLYVGVMAYKYYFIRFSWRTIYVGTTILNGFLSLLQVLLIEGITFGLSPFVFALGDDIFADFIAGVQFLPTTIMMVHLCPSGTEGSSYAMFTTVNNCAGGVAYAISTMLLGIWDVSKETMLSGDFSGMTKLTLLTTALQTAGIFFVKLLPNTKEELAGLHSGKFSGSKIGGFIFLSVVILSVLYAIGVSLLTIAFPGLLGES